MKQQDRNGTLDQLKASLTPSSGKVVHSLLYPAMLLGSGGAAAGIMQGNGPLTLGDGGSVDWNIDGSGGVELNFSDSDPDADEINLSWAHDTGEFQFLRDGPGCELLVVDGSTPVGPGGNFGVICSPFDRSGASCVSGFVNHNAGNPISPVSGALNGLFGFRFDANGGADDWLYGVAEFTFDEWNGDSTIGTFTINRWAYDDRGAAVRGDDLESSAAPVAPTGALMALALGGMAARRRRAH